MAFLKKKEPKKEETKTSSNPQHTSLLEIPYGRVLTAEGWKRRIEQKTSSKSKKD